MSDEELKQPTARFAVDVPEVEVEVTPEDVIEYLPHDQIVAFVQELDEAAEDWDVTLALADYFDSMRQVYQREVAEGPVPIVAVAPPKVEVS